MNKYRILLIDDNEAFLGLVLSLSEAESYDIVPLTSAEAGLGYMEKEPVDLVISDVQMPGMSGTDLFKKTQDLFPYIPFIFVTAFGSTQEAIKAVKEGAFHYFEKPIDNKLELFWTTIREALAKRDMLEELRSLRMEKAYQVRTPMAIIGRAEVIRQVVQSVEEVASLCVNVLIYGETGTGKELVARAIHNLSGRRDKPFVAINCCEFAPGVLESEIFGHEKGAFTGAVDQKIGLFEIAHKGTLFLDEISEAPMSFQTKLLRVLENKTFMRVGGRFPVYSDFRILAATNRNLAADVASGRFRQDLFYRLNVYPVEIPPLRKRKEDIPLIAEFYIKRFSEAYRKTVSGVSTNGVLELRDYDWPGNVRELVNVIERAVITCRDNMITTRDLPFGKGEFQEISDLKLNDVEKLFVHLAMKRTENNKTRAAELLGISRKTLIEKVKIYGFNAKADN